MPLVLNSSGGGSVTLSAPSTASNVTLTAPAVNANIITNKTPGTILQVVSSTKTDTSSTTSTSPVDSGLQATITPTSSTSKILIRVDINYAHDQFGVKRTYFNIAGGNAASYLGDAGASGHRSSFAVDIRAGDGYSMMPLGGGYLDSPSTTSSTTYKLQWCVETGTAYMNRPASEDANGARTASTITLMEIAA